MLLHNVGHFYNLKKVLKSRKDGIAKLCNYGVFLWDVEELMLLKRMMMQIAYILYDN